MSERTAARKRAPVLGDLLIVILGVWGFLRQCLRTVRLRERSHELETGD